MMKLRLPKVQQLAQDQTADKQRSRALNPGLLNSHLKSFSDMAFPGLSQANKCLELTGEAPQGPESQLSLSSHGWGPREHWFVQRVG